MKNLYRKFVNKILLPDSKLSYAQSGEDLILARVFYQLNLDHPVYLDIGANHPSYISNTYYFYLLGGRGVCIEPNPLLYQKFIKVRPRDTVLNIGIGTGEDKEADFYLFPEHAHGLSTFSKEEALYWQEVGMEKVGKIYFEKVIKVPLQSVNTVIASHFTEVPDFISIDVEGLDIAILQSFDFNAYRPRVFCVETLGYDADRKEYKRSEIIDYLIERDYNVYADTGINTIFVKK